MWLASSGIISSSYMEGHVVHFHIGVNLFSLYHLEGFQCLTEGKRFCLCFCILSSFSNLTSPINFILYFISIQYFLHAFWIISLFLIHILFLVIFMSFEVLFGFLSSRFIYSKILFPSDIFSLQSTSTVVLGLPTCFGKHE